MKTLNLIHDETGIEFELDLDLKELMETDHEAYLEKNVRIIHDPRTQEKQRKEEIISRIAEMWPQLDYEDKLEVIEIADLMRQGKWDHESKKPIEE